MAFGDMATDVSNAHRLSDANLLQTCPDLLPDNSAGVSYSASSDTCGVNQMELFFLKNLTLSQRDLF